ncbi:MAG: hypothetical protein KBE16_08440 [Alphaproteobacteria bacterium]|nr:hypothetical protein [Alphaproteobacteria bacterium]MBP9877676.1 hypothetical protein [Alphaproteobacteria bacterium]
MAGLASIDSQSSSRELTPEQTGDRTVSKSSESLSQKVESSASSESPDGVRLSQHNVVVDNSHLSVADIIANREKVIGALLGEKGAPSPILETLRVIEPKNYAKLQALAKTCATKAQRTMIDNYEYDRLFPKVQFSEFDKGQWKVFRKAQRIVMQIASENKLSLMAVLNGLSFISLMRDPIAISQHIIKFNALRRKANKILKQKGENRISLSDAFLAYQDCAEQLHNTGYSSFTYNNQNLVMLPMNVQLSLSHKESSFSFDFSGCRLAEFPECAIRPALRNLKLEGNLFTEIPDCFQNCKDLYEVELSNTMISSLPSSLLMNPGLTNLSIKNTAIDTLPAELDHLPLIVTEDGAEINALMRIDFTGNGIDWKTLSKTDKKVVEKLISLETAVLGITLPKHLRFKNKIKEMPFRHSLKKHVLKI